MAVIDRLQGCCGIRELHHLGGRCGDIIRQVDTAIKTQNLNAAYYLFADRDGTEDQNGERLAKYITKYELGEITVQGPRYNPQSRHSLKVWLWAIDPQAISDWVENHT